MSLLVDIIEWDLSEFREKYMLSGFLDRFILKNKNKKSDYQNNRIDGLKI